MRGLIDRRAVVAGALGAVAATSLGRAAENERIRVNIIPVTDVAPLFVALRRGFFDEAKIAIDTSPSVGGAAGVPGLLGGSYDIVYSNVVSTLLAAQNKLPIEVVAPGTAFATSKDETPGIIVRRESAIKTGRDLEGKTVAVNTRNNGPWLYFRAWIELTGGNPDKVTFREVPFPQMDDALRLRQVDAIFAISPYVTIAASQPENELIAHPYTAVQPGYNGGQYIATKAFVEANKERLDRFAKALRRGIEWYNANRDSTELRQIIGSYTKLDQSMLQRMPLSPAPRRVDPKQMEQTMTLMIKHHILRAPLEIASLIAPSAVE